MTCGFERHPADLVEGSSLGENFPDRAMSRNSDAGSKKARGRRRRQDQTVMLIKKQQAIAEVAEDLIEIFLKADEGGLFSTHLFAQEVKFGGEDAPFVAPIERQRSGEFAARQQINALRNLCQRTQHEK